MMARVGGGWGFFGQCGPDVVKSFMKQLAVNYPVVVGNQQVARDYGGVEAIPTTFIIDRDGSIVREHVDYEAEGVFEKEIKVLLKE
jgi:cytochrome c biogenesis protein CcmG/thiol:disulfide interchange protein DsbE